MDPRWITAAEGFVDGRIAGPVALRVDGDAITDVVVGDGVRRTGVPVVAGLLTPGLIDLQVNGAAGHDIGACDAAGMRAVSRYLLGSGTTSFLPTVVTAALGSMTRTIGMIAALIEADDGGRHRRGDGGRGATIIGVHAEGPFLSPAHRGAHPAEHLRQPTPSNLAVLCGAAREHLALVTLAPELPGGLDAIRMLRERGAVVSVGHSGADEETMDRAASAGASMVTHLFNAQRAFHHRDAGVAGTALADDRFHAGLICDLHHVNPAAIRLAFAAAGERIVLVSDATAATGAGPATGEGAPGEGDRPPAAGVLTVAGSPLTRSGGGPPRRPDGTLAGSAITLADALRNAIGLGVPVGQAIAACTTNPAGVLGRADLGRLAAGARADVVRFDRPGGAVTEVILGGHGVEPGSR